MSSILLIWKLICKNEFPHLLTILVYLLGLKSNNQAKTTHTMTDFKLVLDDSRLYAGLSSAWDIIVRTVYIYVATKLFLLLNYSIYLVLGIQQYAIERICISDVT